MKFGVDDFFCFEGKPVSLILSHKRAATRAALRSCLLKTLPRASAFIRRVETTRVVRHYTGQWTRYERDRRERERERYASAKWTRRVNTEPRLVLINKHTARQPIQFDSYAGTKEIESDVFPLKCQKTLAALERINCIKSRDVRPWIACCESSSSSFWPRMRGGDSIGCEFASLRASFEFESGLHSGGIMHRLATLENVFGNEAAHMCPLINSLEFWGMKFSDCILFLRMESRSIFLLGWFVIGREGCIQRKWNFDCEICNRSLC